MWRPKHPYLCTPWARKGVLWIPRMGVFGMHNANSYGGFYGGGRYAHTSAHHRPENVSRGTWDGAVRNGHRQKIVFGSGVAPETPWARKGVFGYLGWGCFKWTMPQKHCLGSEVWVFGAPPQNPSIPPPHFQCQTHTHPSQVQCGKEEVGRVPMYPCTCGLLYTCSRPSYVFPNG